MGEPWEPVVRELVDTLTEVLGTYLYFTSRRALSFSNSQIATDQREMFL